MSNEVMLTWPPSALSPNARVHWAKKAKAAKLYRHACRVLCMAEKLQVKGGTEGTIHLHMEFYPPRNGRQDADNMLARAKNGIDGIADYLGIDDSNFTFHIAKKDKVTGGAIKVRIESG
jgi:crossover junction endodeoxyribonuclease RusA